MHPTGPYRQALRRIRPALVTVALLSAAVNLLMLTGPLYMLQVYDRVLASGSVATLQGIFVIVVVLYVFLGFYDLLRHRALSRAGHRLDVMVAGAAFDRGTRPGATAAEQPLRDIEILRGFLAGPALGLFDLPWIPLYIAIVWLIHPWLGMLTLAGAGVVVAVALLNQAATGAGLVGAMRMEGAERDFAAQTRRSAEMLRAMGMQARITARWQGMHLRRLAAGQTAGDRGQGFGAFSRTFRLFLQSALLTLAAFLTLQQEISAGMIIASSIISGRALAPVDQVIGQWRAILRAREAHRTCLAVLDAPETRPGLQLPAPTGAVELASVSRLVPGTGPAATRGRILDHVGFSLAPGDGLGVIGASASGKSTLARILVGAIRPDAGEIRLDGALPEHWNPEDLGRHIGYLPQVVEMLPGTVRDNIARFDPLARDADVIATAKLAGVHAMILRLPQGYATMLGPGAEQPLSGGQVQRLGLARALYGNPKLVVLDEPNSNLDQAGDETLTAAIAEMRRRGSTVVVMAHRPGALAAVDRILLLKEGRVAALGPKEQVLGPARGPAPGSGPGSASPVPAAEPAAAPADERPDGAGITPIRRRMPDRGRAALFALYSNLEDDSDTSRQPPLVLQNPLAETAPPHGPQPAPARAVIAGE